MDRCKICKTCLQTLSLFNPIQAGLFLAFYDRGGGVDSPPPENNVTVELGQ